MKQKNSRKQTQIVSHRHRLSQINKEPLPKVEKISIKETRSGLINVSAIVDKKALRGQIDRTVLKKYVADIAKDIVSTRINRSEAFVRFQIKDNSLAYKAAYGVWPPFMITVEKGKIVEIQKQRNGRKKGSRW